MAPKATEWLLRQLKDGPVRHTELVARAIAAGYTDRMLLRAGTALGVYRKSLPPPQGSEWSLAVGPITAPAPAAPPPPPAPAGPAATAATQAPPGQRGLGAPPLAIAELARTVEALQRAGRMITIWRIVPGIPSPAYVTQVAASEFSLGWVKRFLGGGRYIVDTIEVAIEGRPKEYLEPGELPPAAPSVPAQPAGSDINDKLFALVLRQLEASQVRSTVDPMEMALKIVALLRAPETAAAQKPSELVAMIHELRELGLVDTGGGRERAEPSLLDVAQQFAPAINSIAGAIAGSKAGGAPVPSAGTEAASAVLPSPPTAELAPVSSSGVPTPVFPATDVGMVARELYPHIGTINIQARNPMVGQADVAKYLLDHADPKVYATIDAAVSDPQFVESVTDLLAPHVPPDLVPWYRKLAQAVRDDVHLDRAATETEATARRG